MTRQTNNNFELLVLEVLVKVESGDGLCLI